MVGADDHFEAYFNGTLVGGESAWGTGPYKIFDVTALWQEDFENCIAIRVTNTMIEGWLHAVLRVYLEPLPWA